MAPILSQADKHDLTVGLHILTLGKGKEQEHQRENILALIRKCVETAYGKKGLTPDQFEKARFVITLSQEVKTGEDEVVGVIMADYDPYVFDLWFESVVEHMRKKGLARLLFKAAETVILCLARDMASRSELPKRPHPERDYISIRAFTDNNAPDWHDEMMEKVGYKEPEQPDSDSEECYCWSNTGPYPSFTMWAKELEY